MDSLEELRRANVITQVEYDHTKGYPAAEDLYYECPKCHVLMPSFPKEDPYAGCKCGNLSLDMEWGRFSVAHTQPLLYRLTPNKL